MRLDFAAYPEGAPSQQGAPLWMGGAFSRLGRSAEGTGRGDDGIPGRATKKPGENARKAAFFP